MKPLLKEILKTVFNAAESESKQLPALIQVIEQAKEEWNYANLYYNSVTDADLIDSAAYLILATEKKYMHLVKKARAEGLHNLEIK